MQDVEALSSLATSTALPRTLFDELSALLDQAVRDYEAPADIVEYCAPILSKLIHERPEDVTSLVERLAWPTDEDTTYTRRRLMESEDGQWSIYAICWRPGQYTPIHDHGTWGSWVF